MLKPKDEAGLKIKKIQFISRIADKENCQVADIVCNGKLLKIK